MVDELYNIHNKTNIITKIKQNIQNNTRIHTAYQHNTK